MRGLPLPHLFSFILQQTLVHTFQRDDLQCKRFGTEFVNWTESDGESETQDEEFADGVAGLFFGPGRDDIGSNEEGGHVSFLLYGGFVKEQIYGLLLCDGDGGADELTV